MIMMRKVSIEDISGYEVKKQGTTIEGEYCNNLSTILEEKKAIDEGDEDTTADSKIEKLLKESLDAYSLLISQYPNKRDNRRLTLRAMELLYNYALHYRHLCRLTGEEVSIRATYKQLQGFSILIEDYIGDNTTIFRDLKIAAALKIINIDKNSSRCGGTLWRLPKASMDEIIGELEKLNNESKNGAKVGNMCLSQTQMAFGKQVVSDSYIDETLGKRITQDEFEGVLRKVRALKEKQKLLAEKSIMNTLSHEETLIFLSCRSKVCSALNLDRIKYSLVDKDESINDKIHGNTMVYIENRR